MYSFFLIWPLFTIKIKMTITINCTLSLLSCKYGEPLRKSLWLTRELDKAFFRPFCISFLVIITLWVTKNQGKSQIFSYPIIESYQYRTNALRKYINGYFQSFFFDRRIAYFSSASIWDKTDIWTKVISCCLCVQNLKIILKLTCFSLHFYFECEASNF